MSTADFFNTLSVRFGNGWNSLMRKVAADLLSTDNGAFIEVLRDGPSPDSPFIGLAHLDHGVARLGLALDLGRRSPLALH